MSWIEHPRFETFGSFNLSLLDIDKAWINITNLGHQRLWLYRLSTDCYDCPYQVQRDVFLEPQSTYEFNDSTKFPLKYRLRLDNREQFISPWSDDEGRFCDVDVDLGQFGIYNLVANSNQDRNSCEFTTALEPVNVYYRLILASKRGPVDIETLRLPGVLQRFAICYFLSASSMLLCGSEEFLQNTLSGNKFIAQIQDIIFLWKGWIISFIILGAHTLLTFLLPVPGCPTGYLGPGGLHLYKEFDSYPFPSSRECIGGSGGYIDRKILTLSHIFKYPTALETYSASAYDPEGILGTLTSIFQVWLGVQAGMTLQIYQSHSQRLIRWLIWGIICGGIGAALCGAKQTGGLIPINKNLWSLSYVLVTTCFALFLLISLYIIIDMKGWWSGSPFLEPGMNSILLYVGHSIGFVMLPFHFNYMDRFKTHFLKLVEALWGTSLWILIAIYLHGKNYFWSL